MSSDFESFPEKMQDNYNYTENELQDGAEEVEDVLSLSELPLDSNDFEEMTRSQPEPPYDDQVFEFVSVDHPSFEMSPAEDIIFCGNKLTPSSSSSFDDSPKHQQTKIASNIHERKKQHRRSESLSEFGSYATRCSQNREVLMMRTSRSLDDQKMGRFSNSKASTDSADKRPAGKPSPRWYFPMFGISKFPPQMDLRDIKSRQVRRATASVMLDAQRNFPDNRSSSKGSSSSSSSSSSWKFIKALSCKDHANVAVTLSQGQVM